jgi:serine/threonine protein kinase
MSLSIKFSLNGCLKNIYLLFFFEDYFYEEISHGAFGRVWRGLNSTNENVAIKEEEEREAVREMKFLKRFKENTKKRIVKIYDSFVKNDLFYIVMEYCTKKSLDNFIKLAIKRNKVIPENVFFNFNFYIFMLLLGYLLYLYSNIRRP